jgi:hypothetical protein
MVHLPCLEIAQNQSSRCQQGGQRIERQSQALTHHHCGHSQQTPDCLDERLFTLLPLADCLLQKSREQTACWINVVTPTI